MTKTAKRIAKALNLATYPVFDTKLSGPGPAMRGWWELQPGGRWTWLGATAAEIIPTEDDDMRLIVSECDAYMTDAVTPIDRFYGVVHKHDAVLRRTARYLKQDGADESLMPPATLRVCASYLLSN